MSENRLTNAGVIVEYSEDGKRLTNAGVVVEYSEDGKRLTNAGIVVEWSSTSSSSSTTSSSTSITYSYSTSSSTTTSSSTSCSSSSSTTSSSSSTLISSSSSTTSSTTTSSSSSYSISSSSSSYSISSSSSTSTSISTSSSSTTSSSSSTVPPPPPSGNIVDTQAAVDVEYVDTAAYIRATQAAVDVEYEDTQAYIRVTNASIMVEYIPKTGNCGINDMGLITYYEFASQLKCYLSRADEVGLSITGELTFGCWILMNDLCLGKITPVMGKWYETGNQRSFVIYKTSNERMTFSVSIDGIVVSATVNDGGVNYVANQWMYVAGRFIPSTEIAIFVDGTWYKNTTDIPASIFDSTEQLELARYNHYYYLDGGICHAFVSAVALEDSDVEANYSHTKAMFNKQFM